MRLLTLIIRFRNISYFYSPCLLLVTAIQRQKKGTLCLFRVTYLHARDLYIPRSLINLKLKENITRIPASLCLINALKRQKIVARFFRGGYTTLHFHMRRSMINSARAFTRCQLSLAWYILLEKLHCVFRCGTPTLYQCSRNKNIKALKYASSILFMRSIRYWMLQSVGI